jgi:hypothetical protein
LGVGSRKELRAKKKVKVKKIINERIRYGNTKD